MTEYLEPCNLISQDEILAYVQEDVNPRWHDNKVIHIPRFQKTARRKKLQDLTPGNINWLWKPRLVRNKVNLIGGMGDVGKDVFCCALIASMTNYKPWPGDSEALDTPMKVAIYCPEDAGGFDDDIDSILGPRLTAAEAHPYLVEVFYDRPTPADLEGFDVLYVSPIVNLLPTAKNMNSEQDVRDVLGVWQAVPGLTLLGTTHYNKKNDLQAVQRFMGASAWTTFVRSAHAIEVDDEDPELRVFTRAKMNLQARDTDGIRYRIEHVGPYDQSIRAVFVDHTSKSTDEIIQNKVRGQGKETAEKWLLEYLKGQYPNKILDSVVVGDAKEAGYSRDALKKARQRNQDGDNRIATSTKGYGDQKVTYWWYEK